MSAERDIHFYSNWAKERIDEIEATLTSLEGKIGELQADVRGRAGAVLAGLRKRRDAFLDAVAKNAKSNEAAWAATTAELENEWKRFETEVENYTETFGKSVEQQQAIFQMRAAAQLKAWREMTDQVRQTALKIATARRGELDAELKRMTTDAAVAQKKFEQLGHAGAQSWAAMGAALSETRAAFDKANQAAREAFKRAG